MNMKNLGFSRRNVGIEHIYLASLGIVIPSVAAFQLIRGSITDLQDFSLAKILRMEFLNSAPLMAFCQRHE